MEGRRSCFSILLGEETETSIELLAAESFLSGEDFPSSLLSEKKASLLKRYQHWLAHLPRRDANEIAFATLLSEELEELSDSKRSHG